MPHILTPTYLSLRLITVYLLIICRLSYSSFWHVICDYLLMLSGLCSNYDIMMLSCLYYALIMMYDDYHLYEIIVPMRLSCSSRHQIHLFHN